MSIGYSNRAATTATANLATFLDDVRIRRSTRHFRSDPVAPELLDDLLEAARWAPSGFNLQPIHFVVVTEHAAKERLYPACMQQRQILEAGATVILTGDRRVVANNFERVLEQDREAAAISEEYESLLRRVVPLSFDQGPFGLGWLWKAAVEVAASPFTPIPSVQAIHKNYWLAKQAGMSAMAFMLAAHAAGLSTCPMEGFGERQVRRALSIPDTHSVILVIPVGYADNSTMAKTRLPLDGQIHREQW
jgi:nitroreductase